MGGGELRDGRSEAGREERRNWTSSVGEATVVGILLLEVRVVMRRRESIDGASHVLLEEEKKNEDQLRDWLR